MEFYGIPINNHYHKAKGDFTFIHQVYNACSKSEKGTRLHSNQRIDKLC